MNQNHCKFYSFMRATRGNWRNTLYVMCGSNSCPCGKNPPCDGFLMAAAADGSLIVMPVEIVRQFTGESRPLRLFSHSISSGTRFRIPAVQSCSFTRMLTADI